MASQIRALGFTLLAALAGCGGDGAGTAAPGAAPGAPVALPAAPAEVVAKVGGGYVTAEEFGAAAGASPGADPGMPIEVRKEVLDELITEELLFMEAVELGLVRDPKVRKVLVQLLLRQEVLGKITNTEFSDEELLAYYNEHRSEFVLPEKLQVKRILVKFGESRSRVEAEALIKQAQKKIQANPASFREVAESISEDDFARRGGDLGFLAKEGKPGVDSKVAEVAFGQPIGQLSEPFEAEGGLNLVLATARREAVERTFEQMRGSVLRKLRSVRYQEMTERYIAALKADQPVTVDEAALMKVEIRKRPQLDLPDMDEHEHEGEGHPHGEPGAAKP